MDALGFLFEGFDAAGRSRTTEFGFPLNTRATTAFFGTNATFDSSVALTRALSERPEVSECFARHLFRFLSGVSGAETEESFLREWRTEPEEARGSVLTMLARYAESDVLLFRRQEK
jgi:hypothetical protein